MSNYVVSCKVLGLKSLHINLLEQAGCRVEEGLVTFDLSREQEESSDEFRARGARWIGRELSRINVLTSNLFKATFLSFEPAPGNINVNIFTAWSHAPQMPPHHAGWTDEGLEFRLAAWDVASHTDDTVLRFVMLDSICESAGVPQRWINQDSWPPRFAEVRLIRNLLVHGTEMPKNEVRHYLAVCARSISGNRFTSRYEHLELAQLRSAHLVLSVWRVVLRGCVKVHVDLFSDQPASRGGFVIEDQGVYPIQSPRRTQ
jgi:hypothetical protein